MLADLILSVIVAVSVSFLCSMMESALYAVGAPYIRNLAEKGSGAGKILDRFKSDIDKPIAAILILNTMANTMGAVVAGAAAENFLPGRTLILFSVGFTLVILFIGEITPKVLGVTYSRQISRFMAYPLLALTFVLYPLIFLTRLLSSRIRKPEAQADAPEDEVNAMARISAEEGSILPIEKDLILNALKLNEIRAEDLMTPRTVMFSRSAGLTLDQAAAELPSWTFARVPVYTGEEPEEIVGFVMRREVFGAIAGGERGKKLSDFAHPVHFIPETLPGHRLLNEFIKRRQHLFVVVDEYGGIAGVVTLEDVIEFLIGKEIVAELDEHVDMQAHARRQRDEAMIKRRKRASGEIRIDPGDGAAPRTDTEKPPSD